MAEKINFTPFYGFGPTDPLCYLLEFAGCRVLFDCGWDYRFEDAEISPLKRVGNVDCILVSHSTIQHLGAIPYAIAKLGFSCPIYASLPTIKMGLVAMHDAFKGIASSVPNFNHFNLNDIDSAFRRFIPLKYYQTVRLTGRGEGISVTPMSAGNVIGGTLWKVERESDEVCYCVNFNHKIERHLSPAHIEALQRPLLLLTDFPCLDRAVLSRKESDALLLKNVTKCLSTGGDVLLPTDAAGRCLELLSVLYSHWESNDLFERFPLVFLSPTAGSALKNAGSMLEWLSKNCQKQFDNEKKRPFDFKKLILCSSLSDLKFIKKPRSVLATNEFLENGLSHKLFLEMANNDKNLIVLTLRAPETTVAGKLWESPSRKSVSFNVKEIEPLLGEELEEHIQFAREEAEEKRALITKNLEKKKTEEVTLIEESIDFKESKKKRKFEKKKVSQLYPMFLCEEESVLEDDYGEFVDYKKLFRETDEIKDEGIISVEFSNQSKTFIKRNEENNALNSTKLSLKKSKNQTKLENSEVSKDLEKLVKNEPTPFKIVNRILQTDIKCGVMKISFEGRSDGPSVTHIISQISPRKIVLVHRPNDNIKTIKTNLSRLCGEESVIVPKISKRIEIASHSKTLKMILNENLFGKLKFTEPSEGINVAAFRAELSRSKNSAGLPILSEIRGEKSHSGGSGKEKTFVYPLNDKMMLGAPRLVELRNVLMKEGINCKLVKGELEVVSNEEEKVYVKKITTKDFYVFGNVSKTYFIVRQKLYELFKYV